jgi:hypothetical protein
MSRTSPGKSWALGLLAVAALVSACDSWLETPRPGVVATGSADDLAQRLQGTWMRESSEDGVRSRHLLTLAADGAFRETVRVTGSDGTVTEYLHEGTWLFDGTNLKRKYTAMNGKPPSRLNLPFATFQIAFEGRNEFLGIDHIHGNRIRYERVAPDTEL